MSDFQIDYSRWSNQEAIRIAQNIDKDGIKGLSRIEIFDFMKEVKYENIDSLTLSTKSRQHKVSSQTQIPPELQAAIDNFNIEDDQTYERRKAIIDDAYARGEEIMHQLSSDINQAYVDCEAYENITLIPRRWFRWYRPAEFVNFDLAEIQKDAKNNIASLNKLQDDLQTAFEKAHGTPKEEHQKPQDIDIDMEALAQKHLGMSYEEFEKEYKDELEIIKTITIAELNSPDTPQRVKDAHYKAQQYAYHLTAREKEVMRDIRTDSGNKEMQEVFDYGDNMMVIEEMKDDGISEENFAKITNPIMYRAFTQALLKGDTANGVDKKNADTFTPKTVKGVFENRPVIVNEYKKGKVRVFSVNGMFLEAADKSKYQALFNEK